MNIGDWLRNLGLERYEPLFVDNAIDSDVLPVHEIKHDGYRLMARRDPVGIRLLPGKATTEPALSGNGPGR